MLIDGLLIPPLLDTMLAEGRWPRTADDARRQNNHSRVPEDRNRRLRCVYLYAPPFHTVARIVSGGGRDFYARYGRLHELVPEAAVEIGDFGLGSDAPILLDYRIRSSDPQVIYLHWPGSVRPNSWAVMAPSFAEFVELLGL